MPNYLIPNFSNPIITLFSFLFLKKDIEIYLFLIFTKKCKIKNRNIPKHKFVILKRKKKKNYPKKKEEKKYCESNVLLKISNDYNM